MIRYTTGNLLDAKAEALVNTVNTVGVMGKGIALMFRDAFNENFREYTAACKQGQVRTGRMFVTERSAVLGPRWIINFPTKQDWRTKTKLMWVVDGLADLRRVIVDNGIRSIALPPLGCGNGGLDWAEVRPKIEEALGDLDDVDIQVYQPTREYQNVAKRHGVEKLTPARALIAELVRRYWVLGIECSLLEIQKLAWLLQRRVRALGLDDPLHLEFVAHKYGPYAQNLQHLLDSLDGSYLHCEKRIADAGPTDVIWFEEDRRPRMEAYLRSGEAKTYHEALEQTGALIDGFQSPLGMELLATVDWLLSEGDVKATVPAVKAALSEWPGGKSAGQRKLALFDDRMLKLALNRLNGPILASTAQPQLN
jgi:O-acetyl-ADP-ribose deacetylase (regulator of RNase III)